MKSYSSYDAESDCRSLHSVIKRFGKKTLWFVVLLWPLLSVVFDKICSESVMQLINLASILCDVSVSSLHRDGDRVENCRLRFGFNLQFGV